MPLCRLCKKAEATEHVRSVFHHIQCQHCGTFTLTDVVAEMIESLSADVRLALSHASRHSQSEGVVLVIGMQNISRLANDFL